jgi:hypothetical protein
MDILQAPPGASRNQHRLEHWSIAETMVRRVLDASGAANGTRSDQSS